MRNLTDADLRISKLINEGLSHEQVAAKLGISTRTFYRWMKRPEMVARLHAARAGTGEAFVESQKECAKKAAAADIKHLSLVVITPAMIVARLWQLALMGATETRGNIQGQQQALDSIWVKCGFQGQAPRAEDLQDAGPDVYQAEWMRKPQ